MKIRRLFLAAAAAVVLTAPQALARGDSWITLYSAPDYGGSSVDLDHAVRDLDDYHFGDRAQSVRVHGRWLMCAAKDFEDDCITLDHDVPSLKAFDMNRRADSVRPRHRQGGRDDD